MTASSSKLHGWLDNFLPAPVKNDDGSQRIKDFPEQYPATYELNDITVDSDSLTKEAALIRPLLKQTMLESRPLKIVYDANLHGWDAKSFHSKVDGKGAAIVVATYQDMSEKSPDESARERIVGGYNPKGWSSNGGARPSVAAFLFYQNHDDIKKSHTILNFQKLQKVGGGGLACSNDSPDYGISFGPDALVIPLQTASKEAKESLPKQQRGKVATSKLGPYFERGPNDISSLFESNGGSVQLGSLKVLTGIYSSGEEIPYSGAVMDMTSG
eukprot:CAMPEP_0178910008 /NCGR_PEP_ID=MMETSP0786-20121207/8855_1 /TAXON_ID=186022 /ORGANISM="Thalassionema frauenfeldii, Strain CCMP 1798" /LENGTH=270 /DNA_ID=CAMNT_0020582205 /DNA_START=118 /DNA_END=930 /DNA_ORIENTATION=+